MNKGYLLSFAFPFLILPRLANVQELTEKDEEEMKYKAVGLVNESGEGTMGRVTTRRIPSR